MKRIAGTPIVISGMVFVLLLAAYLLGQSAGGHSEAKRQRERNLKLHRELIEMDRSFLTNIITRPNTLASGSYVLETRFAGTTAVVEVVELQFSNGKLLKPPGLRTQDLLQTRNVVFWEQFDRDEEPTAARYVGLIDGNQMWGRVYLESGQGWREGEPPAYGA